MTPTQRGSGDRRWEPDPERTEVLSNRDPDPDQTVVIAPSAGAADERTTPVAPVQPRPAAPNYPTPPGAYNPPMGQFPAPPPPMPPHMPSSARRRRGALWRLLAVAAIALSALAVVLVLRVGPMESLTADKLDITAAQAGVQSVLTDPTTGYGLAEVKGVTCNHGVDPTIFKGATFTCDLTIGGHAAQATITFLDEDGTYSVGRPE